MNELEPFSHDDNLMDIISDFDNVVFDSDCDFWDVNLSVESLEMEEQE